MKPLCFVLIPIGKQPDAVGTIVDFDAVYRDLVEPAIADAGLDPLRAGEETASHIIHKPVFEQLILCRYAVVDLTAASANVFYELGVRNAFRKSGTVLIFAEGRGQPFDASSLKAMPYKLKDDGSPANLEADRQALAQRLADARTMTADARPKESFIYKLVEDFTGIHHTKTDVFREQARYSAEMKERLARARNQGVEALRELEKEFSPMPDMESGVVIDLFLSYRAVKAWQEMIELVKKMSRPLARTTMVQEQLAFALNRAGRGEDAESVLKTVLDRKGESSETYALLGRVYKDRWNSAVKQGDEALARESLEKAIEAYLRGFETDWRDTLPGINAVTLMELRNPPDPRREQLIPIVTYSVERRIASGEPDYWDYATRLELAILGKNEAKAADAIAKALANVREIWEPETTARNLQLIREAREQRKEELAWANEIERALSDKAKA
jgi:tetratricopeptide (TPR) repeat protein